MFSAVGRQIVLIRTLGKHLYGLNIPSQASQQTDIILIYIFVPAGLSRIKEINIKDVSLSNNYIPLSTQFQK
jgi:hypothetical protein